MTANEILAQITIDNIENVQDEIGLKKMVLNAMETYSIYILKNYFNKTELKIINDMLIKENPINNKLIKKIKALNL